MNADQPRLYLLDVEGTVAPLTLTTAQLFPYARAHFGEFLRAHLGDSDVHSDLKLLAEENRSETDESCPKFSAETIGADAALAYLLWLMDRDRKSTALKSLQGKVWKDGFESGELKGTLFADVPAAFARWSASARVAIYSSGSVDAQRLLFRHTIYGDLTPCIAGYFDTRTGPKTSISSYIAIAMAMNVAPVEAIFFSDVVRELDAARDAGFATRMVVREGNTPVGDEIAHVCIDSFDGA
jgi:enolase-phosphatase E1